MKKALLLLSLSVLFLSCKSKNGRDATAKESIPTTMNQEKYNPKIFFKATGNEPFWSVTISTNNIVFTSLIDGYENISVPYADPVRAMDANVKLYKLKTSSGDIAITIQQQDCIDTMTGAISPYIVRIELSNKFDSTSNKMEGCGKYITDYRLHDIWVLETMNGEKITKNNFSKEFPRIEINSTTNKFYGFGGCNSINGTIFYEKGLLRFTNVVSTLMACIPGNKEGEFLKALQSSTTYSIQNNRLSLSNPSGLKLVFRKVD